MGYFKLEIDGTLQSSNKKKDESWLSLDLLEKNEDGSYAEFWKLVDGKYVIDTVKEEKKTIENTNKKLLEDTQIAINNLTKDYPQFEKDTFVQQETEARAYKIDPTASTPFLDTLATARGIDKSVMVDKIISNADALKTPVAKIIGEYQKAIV